jgi:hypothetical protein
MQSQLLVQSMEGVNNAHLVRSAERVVKSGQYKRQRVVSIIPAFKSIPVKVYMSHCSLISPPNQGFIRIAAVGMEVGEAYSQAIEQILVNPVLSDFEYVLTIEHDNCPPPDGIVRLIKRMEEHPELAAVSGLYWCKGPDSTAPHIWGDVNDPIPNYRPQPPVPEQLVECYGLSMGFCLYRMGMFKDQRIPRPLFKTKGSKEEGVGTQDLSFWGEARKYGYRCAVDCAVKVGHWDEENQIMW